MNNVYKRRMTRLRPGEYQGLLPIPCKPWEMINMDFIVEFPPSESFTTVFVINRLSKVVHFVLIVGTLLVVEIAQAFIKEIVRPHGVS